MEKERSYIAIDLKSFYASVEAVERGLDPLAVNLVVADLSRTEKTICLAVSPTLKAYGIAGRARLFEVVQRVGEINAMRRLYAPGHVFTGRSYYDALLRADPSLELDYITARPRMAYYLDYSTRIYKIYLKYVSPEDIHVYSIDEVFIDATAYLRTYGVGAHELAMRMIHDVLAETGITATAGIGTNLYLAKIAMDIVAKHSPPDADGVRIAELDEPSYRRSLWEHRPLTDFWRIGHGIARRLEANGMYTQGDIALRSLSDEDTLYRIFGVNAELIIDHAWGWEPCTMADIKSYTPESSSLSSGQVLKRPYTADEAAVIVREMAGQLALDMVEKRVVGNRVDLYIGYDAQSLTRPQSVYTGAIKYDHYGRKVPKSAHGGANLAGYTSSSRELCAAAAELYGRVVDRGLLVRRVNITIENVIDEKEAARAERPEQLDLFTDYAEQAMLRSRERAARERERRMQEAVLDIRRRFGKNAVIRASSLRDEATATERNVQIGGHKA